MAKRYEQSFKQMVCRRLKSTGDDRLTVPQAHKEFGVPKATLYSWLHSTKYTPVPVSKPTEVPLPRGIKSILEALYITLHCEKLGMNTPEAGLFCRQHGCSIAEVKAFQKWAAPFHNEQLLKQFPTMAETTHNALAKYDEQQEAIAEYKATIDLKDKVISDMTTKLMIEKKLWTILS